MKIQIVFLNMSQFENKIIKAINSGLNLSSNMYEKQHYVGRFISGGNSLNLVPIIKLNIEKQIYKLKVILFIEFLEK